MKNLLDSLFIATCLGFSFVLHQQICIADEQTRLKKLIIEKSNDQEQQFKKFIEEFRRAK